MARDGQEGRLSSINHRYEDGVSGRWTPGEGTTTQASPSGMQLCAIHRQLLRDPLPSRVLVSCSLTAQMHEGVSRLALQNRCQRLVQLVHYRGQASWAHSAASTTPNTLCCLWT
jgi:hypothetical protein